MKKYNYGLGSGWHFHSHEHSLARQGIRTALPKIDYSRSINYHMSSELPLPVDKEYLFDMIDRASKGNVVIYPEEYKDMIMKVVNLFDNPRNIVVIWDIDLSKEKIEGLTTYLPSADVDVIFIKWSPIDGGLFQEDLIHEMSHIAQRKRLGIDTKEAYEEFMNNYPFESDVVEATAEAETIIRGLPAYIDGIERVGPAGYFNGKFTKEQAIKLALDDYKTLTGNDEFRKASESDVLSALKNIRNTVMFINMLGDKQELSDYENQFYRTTEDELVHINSRNMKPNEVAVKKFIDSSDGVVGEETVTKIETGED